MLLEIATSLLMTAGPGADPNLPTFLTPPGQVPAYGTAHSAAPPAAAVPAPVAPLASAPVDGAAAPIADWSEASVVEPRGFLQSDRAFDRFIGPITNPIYSKDPRSLTEARLLFLNNIIPANHPLGGGNFQVYGAQVRVALTERLTFIADKDGYATVHPRVGGNRDGWLNTALGLKYTFWRDVEKQSIGAVGLMFEPNIGESEVFQNNGSGLLTLFSSFGKEYNCNWHFIGNGGIVIPMDGNENSGMTYSSLHIDRRCFGWLYPLAELNWYYWYAGGNHGVPAAVGEGDGLINFGTSGMSGANMVTGAIGLKAVVSDNLSVGAAWEAPLSNRKDLMNNRLTFECILRY